jgi:hypothetical protein
MEPSPAGTAETSREFETKRVGSIATRPCKDRKDGPQLCNGEEIRTEGPAARPPSGRGE